MTLTKSIASLKAFKTEDTELSPNKSDTITQTDKANLQTKTSIIEGKNTSATAIIPITPTLLLISEEYA